MDKTIVISNTSPLINLSKCNALHLLSLLFPLEKYDLIIPSEVIEEIKGPLKKQIIDMGTNEGIIISPPYIESVINQVKYIAQEIAFNGATWNPEQHYTEAYIIVKGLIVKSTMDTAFVLIDENIPKSIAKRKGLRAMTHKDIIITCVNTGIITQREGLELIKILVSKGIKYKKGFLDHYNTMWSD